MTTDSVAKGDEAASGMPTVEGRRVVLRPITPNDYEPLFRLELSSHLGWRWRHRGTTPSYEHFVQSLWQGVLAQYLVADRSTGSVVGFVTAYNANFKDGWAYFAMAKFDPSDRTGRVFEGGALFLRYVFSGWNFRKLYLEVSGYNLENFASGTENLLVEEGRLRDHEFKNGRYWDQILFAIYRSTWARWEPGVESQVVV